ncbi:MAG: hypothetical protein SangKO_059020 [Sandaracinaceae bacterium]
MTRPLRLVLVDDDALLLHGTARALSQAGLTVASFCDARTARIAVLRDPPDVLLIDFHMPGLDGVELARGVGVALGSRCPAIVLWTGSRASIPARDVSLFDAVVDKPCRTPALLDVLRSVGPGAGGVTESGVRGPTVAREDVG